jgi:hypothetical protein
VRFDKFELFSSIFIQVLGAGFKSGNSIFDMLPLGQQGCLSMLKRLLVYLLIQKRVQQDVFTLLDPSEPEAGTSDRL